MPLIFLIGRHASGKSTIGAAMRANGFVHLSVGALRRIAQHRQFPADVPYPLMLELRRASAGAPLNEAASRMLLGHAQAQANCVVDGFPASVEHLAMIPAVARIVAIWAPTGARERRLEARSAATKRIWTPGQHSMREAALSGVMRAARASGRLEYVRNVGDLASTLDLASSISLGRKPGTVRTTHAALQMVPLRILADFDKGCSR